MSDPQIMQEIEEKVAHDGKESAVEFFHQMADFVDLEEPDVEIIRRTGPYVTKHIEDIAEQFYRHLLAYAPTRKFFLKADGSRNEEFIKLRMQHLRNLLHLVASGNYDDTFIKYLEYAGRAHTAHGADPSIYVPERYVVGQMGFIQAQIMRILFQEMSFEHSLKEIDQAMEAWSKMLMVMLEMLTQAYPKPAEEGGALPFAKTEVDTERMHQIAVQAIAEVEEEEAREARGLEERQPVFAAKVAELPPGKRAQVMVDENLKITVFNVNGQLVALRNKCLHQGGPVGEGRLVGTTLICPWHGTRYDVTSGTMLDDPLSRLERYPVVIEGDEVRVLV